MGQARASAKALLRDHDGLRRWYRSARTTALHSRFRRQQRRGVLPGVIVFECFGGRSATGSPWALYEAILADPRFAACRFVWVLRADTPAEHLRSSDAVKSGRTSIVVHDTTAHLRAYARAQVWISCSILPPAVEPSAQQTYLQTWHGTPFKRIGQDVVEGTETAMEAKSEIDARYLAEGRKATWFLSSSPFTTTAFASAFGMPAAAPTPLREVGNPRNDVLLAPPATRQTQAARVRARLGIPAGRRVVLYAPTWRDDQHDVRTGYVFSPEIDLDRLRAEFGADTVLLFRAHYLVSNALDLTPWSPWALDVSAEPDVNNLLLVADVLVTDYSSVFFDYALLDRPIVFYMYDVDHYAARLRGFYLDLADLPGPVAHTGEELVPGLRTALTDPGTGSLARRRLNATYSTWDDGQATGRVLDLLAGVVDVSAP